jgi:DNA-binding LytR/AlgR family response regulator
MSELEQQLNPNSFFRVSRQFIVHIRSIKKIGNFFNSKLILRLKGYPDIKIQISREKSAQLKEWLDR